VGVSPGVFNISAKLVKRLCFPVNKSSSINSYQPSLLRMEAVRGPGLS